MFTSWCWAGRVQWVHRDFSLKTARANQKSKVAGQKLKQLVKSNAELRRKAEMGNNSVGLLLQATPFHRHVVILIIAA